jgi:hypothetical protein
MSVSLINRHFIFTPNDLFEHEAYGVSVAVDDRSVAVKLLKPIRLETGIECEHLIAKLRYQNQSLKDLLSGIPLLCALTAVPDEQFDPDNPCDVSWWRGGGGAAIGDVKIDSSEN